MQQTELPTGTIMVGDCRETLAGLPGGSVLTGAVQQNMPVIPRWVDELQDGMDALRALFAKPRTTIVKLVTLANKHGIELSFRLERKAAPPPEED